MNFFSVSTLAPVQKNDFLKESNKANSTNQRDKELGIGATLVASGLLTTALATPAIYRSISEGRFLKDLSRMGVNGLEATILLPAIIYSIYNLLGAVFGTNDISNRLDCFKQMKDHNQTLMNRLKNGAQTIFGNTPLTQRAIQVAKGILSAAVAYYTAQAFSDAQNTKRCVAIEQNFNVPVCDDYSISKTSYLSSLIHPYECQFETCKQNDDNLSWRCLVECKNHPNIGMFYQFFDCSITNGSTPHSCKQPNDPFYSLKNNKQTLLY